MRRSAGKMALGIVMAGSLLLCAFPVFSREAADADEGESRLYRVKAGETVGDLAERFLGGEQYAPELLKYNEISNPLTVKEGTLLAIPGEDRIGASAAFKQAEQEIEAATSADAETYAAEELQRARDAHRGGLTAWSETAYLKAESLCRLAVSHAREAVRLADERAPVSLDAVITSVDGEASVAPGDADDWQPARDGMRLPVHARLRTGKDARVEVALPGGSKTQIHESTEIRVADLIEDRRTGRMTTRLRLILGEIFGRIEKQKTQDSVFEIRSGETTTAIRGTDLRMNHGEDVTRVMTLSGSVLVSAADWQVAVAENEGVAVDKGREPRPVALPPPPRVKFPEPERFETASQTIAFSWAPDGERAQNDERRHGRAARYHLEIARDRDFNHLAQNAWTPDLTLRSTVLAPGTYFWRMSSADKDALEGPWGKVRELVIRRALSVRGSPDVSPFVQDGANLVPPGTRLVVAAATGDTSVTALEISLDGSPYEPYSQDFALTEGGEHKVLVRGIGADGVRGKPLEMSLLVDDSPPVLEIHMSKPTQVERVGRAVHVTVSAEDNFGVSRIEAAVDGKGYHGYLGPLVLSCAQDHELRVRAVDVVGNISPARKFQVLKVE